MSETSKHLMETLPYLVGNGIDIGCGDDPVKENCVGIDLPEEAYECYNGKGESRANLRAYADDLPFKDHSLDWVYSSHLLEDFPKDQWFDLLSEWRRVVRPGGFLVILVPERERWQAALAKGQPPNCAHQHEPQFGELTQFAPEVGLTPIRESRLGDYSILFVAQKI